MHILTLAMIIEVVMQVVLMILINWINSGSLCTNLGTERHIVIALCIVPKIERMISAYILMICACVVFWNETLWRNMY